MKSKFKQKHRKTEKSKTRNFSNQNCVSSLLNKKQNRTGPEPNTDTTIPESSTVEIN